ncbi:sec-independent protein translocase protein TatE [Salmonella enterica subsp. enterica]|nr:sec-independent protein translocase protein TatE [Salmonella enterica subsp. enterica]
MGEISITKLLVVAALVVLLFGTKKLRTLGGDLGTAIKGFKKAMNDEDAGVKKDVDGSVQAEKTLAQRVIARCACSAE